MKSAYELAMERLNKTSPAAKLSGRQKAELAETDSIYKARIAEREISFRESMGEAAASGEGEKWEQLQRQLAIEKAKLQADCEAKKEKIRAGT